MSRWEVWMRTDHRRLGGWYISGTLMVCAVVAFGALLGVSWVAGWSNLWHGLLQADWPWLIVAPAAVVVSHLGYSLPYREVARVDRSLGLGGEEAVAMVTTGFGPFSPGSGFALDARGLRTAGLTKQDAGRRVLALGMLEYAILAPATFACALYLLRGHWHARAGVLSSWVVGVPAGAVVVVGLLLCYRHAGCPDTWWFPVRHSLDAIDRAWSIVCSRPGGALALAGMSVYWVADVAVLAACMAVFTHGHPGGPALVVGYATGYALTRRSLPLGGAGVIEAALPFALSWVGYPFATAVLAVVAYRSFNLWFAVVPAIAGLRQLRRKQSPAAA
jgi:uncharacterized membrane protein YbhN (UPF0104 family)